MIELLSVMTLLAMLIALVFGAAQYVIKNAHQQQANTTATALQVAISSYRHEYGQWPIPSDATLQSALSSASTNGPPVAWAYGTVTNSDSDGICLNITGLYNFQVFDQMRAITNNGVTAGPSANEHNVRFIDDSTVLAESSQDPSHNGQFVRRFLLPSGGDGMIEKQHAIVYQTRNGSMGYYSVTIWFGQDKCAVGL